MDQFQEFALKFVRGDFRRASAGHGRFRDYLKAALRNLVTDYHRQRQAQPLPLPADLAHPTSACDDADEFLTSWREELLSKTWNALAAAQPTLHAVLFAHVNNPDATAAALAVQVSVRLERFVAAGNTRVMLHRARTRFAELLVAEVSHSLGAPTEEQLRDELRALRLRKLCSPAFQQLRQFELQQ
jgi:RNA polymerase sigma-70 factor (ECF subfamily)